MLAEVESKAPVRLCPSCRVSVEGVQRTSEENWYIFSCPFCEDEVWGENVRYCLSDDEISAEAVT